MKVEEGKDKGRAVRMKVSKDRASVNVRPDPFDGGKGKIYARGVMPGQQDSGYDLKGKKEPDQRTEASIVGQVCWRRVVEEVIR